MVDKNTIPGNDVERLTTIRFLEPATPNKEPRTRSLKFLATINIKNPTSTRKAGFMEIYKNTRA